MACCLLAVLLCSFFILSLAGGVPFFQSGRAVVKVGWDFLLEAIRINEKNDLIIGNCFIPNIKLFYSEHKTVLFQNFILYIVYV